MFNLLQVRANMFEDQEQKKKQLRSLHAIKTELEQELIDARASSASEKTLRQMEVSRGLQLQSPLIIPTAAVS